MVLLAFATLNHCPLLLDGVTLPDQFAAAADAGFTFVSPDIFSLRSWRETGQTYDQLADALAASGLECYDIAGLNVSGSDDATQAEADEMLPFATALLLSEVSVMSPVSGTAERELGTLLIALNSGPYVLDRADDCNFPLTPTLSLMFLNAIRCSSAP